jgi:restriction system protein
MEKKMYMVRAGEKSSHYDEFYGKNYIGIGWNILGDLTAIKNLSEIKTLMEKMYPTDKKQKISLNSGQIKKFLLDMKVGDYILTYNSEEREYSLGKITSGYKYDKNSDFNNIRDVVWENTFSRDLLTNTSKYSLGSLATVFEISDDVKKEIIEKTRNKNLIQNNIQIQTQADDSLDIIKEDFEEKAHEFIKDKVSEFDWEKMQELVAALIRALGFKTKISQIGPDRGKDIIASPDGLGLNDPRILVEVKHRKGQMGSQEIRSFLGAFRDGNKGIYVSTGGFSKDAKYEAERANHPITLIDIDYLVDLIIANYDNFDIDGRAIIPLKKIYWPI